MPGIVSYGAYIPIYRLSRQEVSRAWGTPPPAAGGEKAIANFDEDSLTMGVEAAIDCLRGLDRQEVDGLYFASTTPPYREKQSASILAAAADLRRDIFTADFSDSLRGGTCALRAALDAVKAGSARKVLVVAADRRIPAPASEHEMVFGDGAAALLVGEVSVAVEVAGSYSITSEFLDVWRREAGDTYYRTWEDRFIAQGYSEIMQEAVSGLLKKYELAPGSFAKAVIYAPDARTHRSIVPSLGFDPKTQVGETLYDKVGNTGAAMALMMLVAALEEAKAGEKLLLASYGDGCDALALHTTEQIEKIKDRRGIKKHLASRMALPNYERYLRFRSLMEWEPERRPPERSALTVLWRESSQIFRLHAGQCRHCGTIQFPIQRICGVCQARGDYEEVPLADKKGTLFTYSLDERAMVEDLPNVMSIVDFEGGGRFYCVLTDRDPSKVEVGMPVEMTFRNMHDGSGLHNYYWKARPVRG